MVEYCKLLLISIVGKTKLLLLKEVPKHIKKEILEAIKNGTGEKLLKTKIKELANEYSTNLELKIIERKEEMNSDDTSHYLIYRVLGISNKEGQMIDEYQNTGRFLYKYAGSFLEEAASLCLLFNNIDGGKVTIKNNQGLRPKTFEIDFLDGNKAFEIKWRDATTDGDHITKEHTRMKAIKSQGYKPIRVMFYYPQRKQAIRIQETLRTLYAGVDGEYYGGDEAWTFFKKYTGFDLKSYLIEIADNRTPESGS